VPRPPLFCRRLRADQRRRFRCRRRSSSRRTDWRVCPYRALPVFCPVYMANKRGLARGHARMCTNAGESPDRPERPTAVMSPFQLILTLAVLVLPFTVDMATAQPKPGVSDPMPAPMGPASPSPLQPGDAFGEQVTLPERTMVYLKGHSKWDSAFDTLIDA